MDSHSPTDDGQLTTDNRQRTTDSQPLRTIFIIDTMTKSVADKTPISATLRGHTDPPGMWVSILLCSAMLHASAFLILRCLWQPSAMVSLDFDSFKPKRLSNSIPIEFVQLPKRQARTQPRVIAQQPKAPRQLQSKPTVVKPQVTTPQPPPVVQPQLVKPVILETQQRDTIAFANPSITKKTLTPTPKIQPSIKPKIEQKTSPKPQPIKNIVEQQRIRIAQQQRQQELEEQQRTRIAQQQRQQELEEQQRNASRGEKLPPPPNVNKTSPGGGTKINPGEKISLGEGKTIPGVGEFLTATSDVPGKEEQDRALKRDLPQTYARLIGNKKKSLRSLDGELITQPIKCPVWLFIDRNGNISGSPSDKGIQVIRQGITEPQRVLCQKYAEEYFKDAKFEPAVDKDGKKPDISQLLVYITIQPNIGTNSQSR